MKTFALQGDTLDAICVRYYGRTEGVVEAVLAANPGLAELGDAQQMIIYAFAAELTEALRDEGLKQQVLARIGQRLPGGVR